MVDNTARQVLDDAGKTAFRSYLDKGGNFVGVHSASDALRNTTWFQEELGERASFLYVYMHFLVFTRLLYAFGRGKARRLTTTLSCRML